MSDVAAPQDWVVLDLDPAAASRASLPTRIVAPSDAPELRDGQLTRAVAATWASRFIQAHPTDPAAPALRPLVEKEGLWRAAEDALAAEDWDSAMPYLEQILKIDPIDAAARFNHASGLRARGDGSAALKAFQAIRPAFDGEGVYHANVARTYEEMGRREEAIRSYRRALELLPDDGFVIDRLVELGALAVAQDEEGNPVLLDPKDLERAVREDLAANAQNPDYLVEAAQGLLQAGNADLARNAAQLALAADPARDDARLFLGLALAQLGKHREALAELDRHVEATPTSALGHVNRAQVLLQLDRRAEARSAAVRALELDANSVSAVQIAIAGNDGSEAVLGRAIDLTARYPRSWAPSRVAGDLALHLGRVEEAFGHYVRSIDLGADEQSVGAIMGALGQQGRIDEVCQIADELPRLVAREPGIRWNAAFAYEQTGRSDEARIIYASVAHDEAAPPDLREAAAARVAELAPKPNPMPGLASDDDDDEAAFDEAEWDVEGDAPRS